MDKLVRGTTDLHLSNEGRDTIRQLSRLVEEKGGFWRVYCSDQSRAVETAHLLVKHSHNTTFMSPTKNLSSWALGGMEGKPVKDVLPEIKRLVSEAPWVVPVGMGKNSLHKGESFNEFKTRVLDEVRRIMDVLTEHPSKRIAVVTHFHDIALVRAWLAKYKGKPGVNDDLYDPTIYNEDKGYPGEVCWLHKQGDIWKLNEMIDLNNFPIMPSGIYFVRHGSTNWN